MKQTYQEQPLRRADVMTRCAIDRTRLWEENRAGRFPAPVATGRRARASKESEVQAYVNGLMPARGGKA